MNPNYNNQQPYGYHQHNPGPPQPPWQPDQRGRMGWVDPRLQNVQQQTHYGSPSLVHPPNSFSYSIAHSSNTPPPPPPPPQVPYSPSQNQGSPFRPAEPQYDTAQWGVRYNQGQYQNPQPQASTRYEDRPALPPRPSSALAQNVPAPINPNTWQQSGPIAEYPSKDSWYIPGNQYQTARPPTPPPRPTAYTSQVPNLPTGFPHEQHSHGQPTHHYDPQQTAYPHEQHSHGQPTHHYDPSVQHSIPSAPPQYSEQPPVDPDNPPQTPSWGQAPPTNEGRISPIGNEHRRYSIANRSHTVSPMVSQVHRISRPSLSSSALPQKNEPQVGATALGQGQPSDWQHYHSHEPYDQGVEETGHASIIGNVQTQSYTASPDPINAKLVGTKEERIHPPGQPYPSAQDTQNVWADEQRSRVQADRMLSHSPVDSLSEDGRPQRRPTGGRSTSSSITGVSRAGTIDSVIQAWTTPLRPASHNRDRVQSPSAHSLQTEYASDIAKKLETSDSHTQTDFPPEVRTETRVETHVETKEVEVDPYRDLLDQYGATLKRFAQMLRQEAKAADDEEKFKIFQGFVIHELRLRSVLYGIEAQHTSHDAKPVSDARRLPPIDTSTASHEPDRTVRAPQSVPRPQTPPQQIQPKPDESPPIDDKDESFVVVNAHDGDASYSPGGRPIVPGLRSRTPHQGVKLQSEQRTNQPTKIESTKEKPISPGANAPMTLDDYVMPDQVSPSNDAPMVVGSERIHEPQNSSPLTTATLTGPLNFQPPRPVYTPFRYNTPAPTNHNVKVENLPEDYNALRQSQAAESGRILMKDTLPPTSKEVIDRGHMKTPSLGRREHEEAFIGLIRQQSKVIRKTTPKISDNPPQLRVGTPLPRNTESPGPSLPPLTKTVRSLRSLVPKSLPEESSALTHPKLEPIVTGLFQIKDEFGFIRMTVLAWDKTNRAIRNQLETERAKRQSENESRVDDLFNENEIGYADIGNLESEFKLDEAGKKYQEDKLELESFVKDVFQVVVDRMESELSELTALQVLTRDLLDLSSSGAGNQISLREGKDVNGGKVPMVSVADVALQLFDKIEIRHQKIAEAHFECERRRKRLELSVLYTNSDTAGIKKLEKDFASAEAIQILEESRRKDERANKLMDSFDRAIVRGLAENQAWIEEVLPKLQLLRDLVLGSTDNAPRDETERDNLFYGEDGITTLTTHIQSCIDFILHNSESLLKSSYRADQILNEADFAIILSEERIAGSDKQKIDKLAAEKKEEDKKIRDDFEARNSGLKRTPEEMLALMREITGKVGTDREHVGRVERALEEAKKRNMASGVEAGGNN